MRSKTIRPRRKQGLTLVELMVALSVIAIALLSLMVMILNSMNLKEMQRHRALAKQAAMAKLEEIKAADFAFIALNYGTGGPDNTFTVDGLNDSTQTNSVARGVISIDSSNADLLDLTVTVTWEAVGGQRLTYEARSLYTQ